MALNHPHEKEQVKAIKNQLETAPKVQKQLKEKFGYGENMFFDLDLIEYRIHNSIRDIAEDLDFKSIYGLSSDNVAKGSVSSAFRGHNNEEFLPECQFEGLFGEKLNDLIEESRRRINGRKTYELGHGAFSMTAEERSEISRKSYAKGLGKLTAKELSENSRKGALALGNHIWSLDELLSLHEIHKKSVGKGLKKTQPCMTYVTEKFNERHGTELTKMTLKSAYYQNKHRLSEAGVEIAEPFSWTLDKILSLHKIREESIGKGYYKSKPCMTYTTEKFNEIHGTDYGKNTLRTTYSLNKHRLSEEE